MNRYGTVLKELLTLGVMFCVMRYVADFSLLQSAVLSIALFVLYALIYTLREAQTQFKPYRISVEPNLVAILRDFDLVADSEESWTKLRAGIENLPQGEWNIWGRGRSHFSLLFLTKDLIYDEITKSFATKVDVMAGLEPVGITPDGQVAIVHRRQDLEDLGVRELLLSPHYPWLHFEQGGSGYRLSIRLPIKYWEAVRKKPALATISNKDVDVDHPCGTAEILLATVPFEEFDVHHQETGDSGKKWEAIIRRRVEARSRYGLKGEALKQNYKGLYDIVTTAEDSDSIEHKYFSLWHSEL